MAEPTKPRRPAMLSASRAEAIIGDEDPAESAAVAHTAAWALMGVGDDEFDDEAVARLRAHLRGHGAAASAHVGAQPRVHASRRAVARLPVERVVPPGSRGGRAALRGGGRFAPHRRTRGPRGCETPPIRDRGGRFPVAGGPHR